DLFAYWSEDQFQTLAEYLSAKYITKSNYLFCEGRAVISFYHVNALKYLYGPRGLARRVNILRAICLRSGIRLHVVGLFSIGGGWNRYPGDAGDLPFDSYSCYVGLPDFESHEPVQSFPRLAKKWLTVAADVGPA